MKAFLVTAMCCLLATSVASAQQINVKLLNIIEPLPEYTKQMDDATFQSWAEFHNRTAYQAARERAEAFRANILPTTTVVTTTFDINSQNEGTRGSLWVLPPTLPRSARVNGTRRETTRIFSRDTWGGGPVTIINPYFRGD